MNRIRDEIDEWTLANQIRLEREAHDGSFLLVEGSNDAKLFSKFCDHSQCSIIICFGKDRLLKTLTVLKGKNFSGVLGFADKDFMKFVGCPLYEGSVVFSDENDIEMMILCSPALDSVLREYGTRNKIASTEDVESKPVCDLIFEAASFVGALRLNSQLESWYLSFDGMVYQFVDRDSYLLDENRTVQHVIARSRARLPLTDTEIVDHVRRQMTDNGLPKVLCCGHDCVRILGKAFQRKIGNTNQFNGKEGAKNLERNLRLAYEYDFFRETNAYKEIRQWERASGFKVLQ